MTTLPANRGLLRITTPSDLEIAMTREFNAPRALVFDAYTKPELLRRWLGVFGGWSLDVCEIDLRVGGKYRWVWRKGEGIEMGAGGVYLEIDAPARIVSTEKFDDPWYEGESIVTVEFVEIAGRTTMTTVCRYGSKSVRDGVLASPMDQGVAVSYDVLEDVLKGLA